MSNARCRAAAILALGLLLSGCRAGLATLPAATEAPTATPLPSASPTASPPAPAPTSTPIPPITVAQTGSLRLIATLGGHTAAITALDFSPDGALLASASGDHSIRLWSTATGRSIRRLDGHTDVVWSLAFAPDGQHLVSGSDDRTLRIWEAGSGRLIDTVQSALAGRILQVAYSPDGQWIAGADQFCLVQIRSARTGVLYRSLLQPGCSPSGGNVVEYWGLAFTSDSRQLLTGEAQSDGWGSVQAWDVDTYASPRRIQGPNGGVRALALSTGDQTLALAFASLAEVWVVRVGDGAVLHRLVGHGYAVRGLAISADGRLLATASADRSVKLWDLENGELLATLQGHAAAVTAVAFSPDGSRLATGDDEGVILMWGAD